MNCRRGNKDERCPKCKINRRLCFCSELPLINTQTNILIIMHVSELKLTSNTANLAKLVLPKAEIRVRGKWHTELYLEDVAKNPEKHLFLYPYEDAVELNEQFCRDNPGPFTIIIPDGNWSQAQKVKKRQPELQDVRSIKLPPGPPSGYKLRTAPSHDHLSTFEALARALGILENKSVEEQMEQAFQLMVERNIFARTKFS